MTYSGGQKGRAFSENVVPIWELQILPRIVSSIYSEGCFVSFLLPSGPVSKPEERVKTIIMWTRDKWKMKKKKKIKKRKYMYINSKLKFIISQGLWQKPAIEQWNIARMKFYRLEFYPSNCLYALSCALKFSKFSQRNSICYNISIL